MSVEICLFATAMIAFGFVGFVFCIAEEANWPSAWHACRALGLVLFALLVPIMPTVGSLVGLDGVPGMISGAVLIFILALCVYIAGNFAAFKLMSTPTMISR